MQTLQSKFKINYKMFHKKQKPLAGSSRNSTCSIDKSNQRSRRSSFVQTLIAQYKNSSQKKSQQQSHTLDLNFISQKTSMNSKINFNMPHQKDSIKLRDQQNIPLEGKANTVRRVINQKDQSLKQQVHFPLKQINFMDKYRSTQLPKSSQTSTHFLSRKPTQAKKKLFNPNLNLNLNKDSHYQSQFLKTIFLTKGKISSQDRTYQNPNSTKKANTATNLKLDQIFYGSTQTDNYLLIRKELQQSEDIFVRQYEKVVGNILGRKYQQGLDQLLKMRKQLKETAEKYQYGKRKDQGSTQIQAMIEKRQFITLFLYSIILFELNEVKSQNQLTILVNKLQKKFQALSRSLSQQQKAEVSYCMMIIKVNEIHRLISRSLTEASNQRSLNLMQNRERILKLIKVCEQIKINLNHEKRLFNLIKDLFSEQTKGDSCSKQCSELQQRLSSALQYFKTQLFNIYNCQANTKSNMLEQCLEILYMIKTFQTCNIIWNNLRSQIVGLRKEQIKQFLPQTQQFITTSLYSNIKLDNQSDYKTSLQNQIAKSYHSLIQQAILCKVLLLNRQNSNIKQQVFNNLENQIKSLSLFFSTPSQVAQQSQSKKLESQKFINLELTLMFPQLFICHYNILTRLSSSDQEDTLEKTGLNYFHQQIYILQQLKTAISLHINQNQIFSQSQFEEIQLSIKNRIPDKLFLAKIDQSQISSLNEWVDCELIKLYYVMGQISTATQSILQKYSDPSRIYQLYDTILTENFNRREQNSFSWVSYLNSYMKQNQINLLYINWKTLHLASQLNLSSSNSQTALLSQIFLHLLNQTIKNIQKHTQYPNFYSVSALFKEIFNYDINYIMNQNNFKEQTQNLIVQMLRIIELYTCVESISLCKQNNSMNFNNIILDTFADDQSEHQQSPNSSLYSYSRKHLQYEQSRPEQNNQRTFLINIIQKLRKPQQYYTNLLKSQFSKDSSLIQAIKNSLPNQLFLQIYIDLKDQFQILMELD